MQEIKVKFSKGGTNYIARSKKNPEVYYFSSLEADGHIFSNIQEARSTIEGKNFFGFGKSIFNAEAGNAAWPLFGQIDGLWLDEAGNLGMHIDVDQESKSGILKQGAEANGLISVSRTELIEQKPVKKFPAGGVISSVPEGEFKIDHKAAKKAIAEIQKYDDQKQEIKRLKKELEKKPTVDEALDVLANEYIMNPVEIYEAIRIYNREKNYPDPVDKRHLLQASEIGEQYCLEMSKKIADFILDPARRKLVGVMAIEKAAGIPISTISNFISTKKDRRDRIPLHHIGSIVKVLEVIGFKA